MIVRTIVELAHNLGLRAVGEGIETEEAYRHAARLRLRRGPGLPDGQADARGPSCCELARGAEVRAAA